MAAAWVTAKADFLVHVKPLAILFRAKLRAALRQTALWNEIPAAAWQQPWVVDCRPVGTAQAALKYLAPYIFRVALSNNRIVRVADDQVTFRYTVSENRPDSLLYACLPRSSCIVSSSTSCPRASSRCAYYGLLRVGNRRSLARLRSQLRLLLHMAEQAMPAPAPTDTGTRSAMICPSCGQPMRFEGEKATAAQSWTTWRSEIWQERRQEQGSGA